MAYFAPQNYGNFANKATECTQMERVSLSQLNLLYDSPNLAMLLVKLHLSALWSQTGTRQLYEPGTLTMNVNDFLQRYGDGCGVYQFAVYCATYSDYKETLPVYFAYEDFKQQYKRKFLPAWYQMTGLGKSNEQQESIERKLRAAYASDDFREWPPVKCCVTHALCGEDYEHFPSYGAVLKMLNRRPELTEDVFNYLRGMKENVEPF